MASIWLGVSGAGYFGDFGSIGSGSTMVFDEPSGADCMPGGDWPCGLEAGAPPVVVLSGPVQPCGCNCPFVSGDTVRPVVVSGLSAFFSSVVCAHANPESETKQAAATRATRIIIPPVNVFLTGGDE